MNTGARIQALRKTLRMRQEDVAVQSGGRLSRVEVNKLENNRTKAGTWETRRGLAEAFKVPVVILGEYLDGAIELDAVLAQVGLSPTSEPRDPTRRFRDRPEWPQLVLEARRLFRAIPPEYIDQAGDFIDNLPVPIDAQFVGDLSRCLWDVALRGTQMEEHEAPSTVAPATLIHESARSKIRTGGG